MLRITSKKDGFRRAGRAHVGTSTYPKKSFTQQQLEQLLAEPLLVVELLESDTAEAAAEAAAKAAAETEAAAEAAAKTAAEAAAEAAAKAAAEAAAEAAAKTAAESAKVEAKAATNKKAQGK